MKKHLISIFLAFLVILAAACSKNQKKVNSIQGAWRLVYVDGIELADSLKINYIFDQCIQRNKKNNGYCEVYIYNADTEVETGYKFTDKGTKLVFREYVNEFSYTNSSDVNELLDSTMIITNSAGGNATTLTFKRQ